MCKICVFAGTTEGRELIEFLCTQQADITACVATEYGQTLLEPRENLTVFARRMNQTEMAELLAREQFDLVIDATHPYAAWSPRTYAKAAAAPGPSICGCCGSNPICRRMRFLCRISPPRWTI